LKVGTTQDWDQTEIGSVRHLWRHTCLQSGISVACRADE
jgi:hypothetical protein